MGYTVSPYIYTYGAQNIFNTWCTKDFILPRSNPFRAVHELMQL